MRSSFDRVVPRLTEQGFRVLVPTQRGYAATARPLRRRDYRMPELVADVVALLDAAGLDRVHLVGHDWGGGVAWSFAAAHAVAGAHPDRALDPASGGDGRRDGAQFSGAEVLVHGACSSCRGCRSRSCSRTLVKTLSDSGLPKADATRYAAAMTEPGALTAALNWYRGMQAVGVAESPGCVGAHDLRLG